MVLLIAVAFVAGVVTALSPCVLPVLPVVLAGGSGGGERRPYAVVAGLVVSFTAFTLAATALLSALGLPDDLLRNVAIAVVALVGLSLLWPRLGELLERPFARLGRRAPGDVGGGFLLGLSLGLVYTPCAGPVIGAVATVAATQSVSFDAVLVTLAYALGSGVVLLGLALAGRRGLALPRFRRAAPTIRRVLGGAVVAVAVLMALGVDTELRTRVPEYTRALQGLETSGSTADRIDGLLGPRTGVAAAATEGEGSELEDFGPAPEFAGIDSWLNGGPLTMDELRGKVVVLDFWTYSCVNCLRTLPYLKRWDETYRDDGLVLVGVHTPEFAFERERSNVADAVKRLGLEYPVALDSDYGTWEAWGNRYWPAKYFVDRRGQVRYAHFGEGDYEKSERVIRELLDEPGLPDPVSGDVSSPGAAMDVGTPETYLGYGRLEKLEGSEVQPDVEAEYAFPDSLPFNGLAYAGRWRVEEERIVAGRDARLRLGFTARTVNLVLGIDGRPGAVEVYVDGKRQGRVEVRRDDLYTLATLPGPAQNRVLELRFAPGTQAYAFTFG
jgi:cytochrome c biogenesis protein CcdA/thiol-disulfide isomerase/thioredoxin